MEELKKHNKGIIALSACLAGDVACLLYTSDAADDLLCVDLGGRRIIKKKKL
ncbi:DNA polymerase III DnaE [Clostridium difficile BI1] [Clostridioides difficile]|nr:DNA polymerase III DnaE [Clostridium difficile BI1] [Clostridioides difficile]